MGLRYPKNMFVLKVCRQNVLYFYRIWGFFYNNVCLQKHIMVILFWCKYRTIKCFLHSQENLICFLIISILRKVFLVLLVRVIIAFVFVLIRIVDEVFLIQKVTFVGKFYYLYCLISFLSRYHNEFYQKRCYSLGTVLVNVCFYCHMLLVFHQVDLCFYKS